MVSGVFSYAKNTVIIGFFTYAFYKAEILMQNSCVIFLNGQLCSFFTVLVLKRHK